VYLVTVRAFVVIATPFALVGVAPAQASPDDVEFEADTMSVPASGVDRPYDPKAKGQTTLRISHNSTVTKTVIAPRSSVHLFVRARGDSCVGAPEITVTAGGERWYAGPLNVTSSAGGSSNYKWIGKRLSLPAGSHTVSISMTNDYALQVGGVKVCDRNAYIDTVTLVASPFAATGWRNKPLPDDAPIVADSELPAELHDQVNDGLAPNVPANDPDDGVWVNHDSNTASIYVVPPDQPTVRVRPTKPYPQLSAQWASVPLPPDARPSDGERHLVVWQPSTDTLWEFIGLRKTAYGWVAVYGGQMPRVSRHQGHFEDPPLGMGRNFGSTATSISLLAGTQRIEEIRRGLKPPQDWGAIDHAIDFAVATPRGASGWCWPAQRTDDTGISTSETAIPAGTRFRLPPDLDVSSLPPYTRLVAEAVKRYGMVARDQGALPVFFAEDWAPTGENPYPVEFWNGRPPNANPASNGLFKDFPWDKLEVLAPAGTGCTFR
jgi:hypothetical protein